MFTILNGCHSLYERCGEMEFDILALVIFEERTKKEKEYGITYTSYIRRIFILWYDISKLIM